MAKFVVLAREAFKDLVRGLKSTAVKPTGKKTTDVSGMLRLFNERRDAIQRSYRKATGKELPGNKVAVPKALYEQLKSSTGIKKSSQAAAKLKADESTTRYGGKKFFKEGPGRHQQPKRGVMIQKGSINRRLEGPNTRIERYGGTREDELRELDRKRIEERDVARNREIPHRLRAYRSGAPERLNRTKYRRGHPDFESGDEYLRQRQSEEGY